MSEEAECCCCGHPLIWHVDETTGWRCHCLGPDGYQCECFLRKGRYDNGLEGYDAEKRVAQHIVELKEEEKKFMVSPKPRGVNSE